MMARKSENDAVKMCSFQALSKNDILLNTWELYTLPELHTLPVTYETHGTSS
jgi:hypothetical protein